MRLKEHIRCEWLIKVGSIGKFIKILFSAHRKPNVIFVNKIDPGIYTQLCEAQLEFSVCLELWSMTPFLTHWESWFSRGAALTPWRGRNSCIMCLSRAGIGRKKVPSAPRGRLVASSPIYFLSSQATGQTYTNTRIQETFQSRNVPICPFLNGRDKILTIIGGIRTQYDWGRFRDPARYGNCDTERPRLMYFE